MRERGHGEPSLPSFIRRYGLCQSVRGRLQGCASGNVRLMVRSSCWWVAEDPSSVQHCQHSRKGREIQLSVSPSKSWSSLFEFGVAGSTLSISLPVSYQCCLKTIKNAGLPRLYRLSLAGQVAAVGGRVCQSQRVRRVQVGCAPILGGSLLGPGRPKLCAAAQSEKVPALPAAAATPIQATSPLFPTQHLSPDLIARSCPVLSVALFLSLSAPPSS